MRRPFGLLLVVVIALFGFYLLRPAIEHQLFAETTPRSIHPRGDLAEFEKLTIDIFDRVSPSVVQVAGRAAAMDIPGMNDEGSSQGGTGFVWDRAGHIVTNHHVVQGAARIAVRFSSGEAVAAHVVGGAPNYDLAVIRVTGVSTLPPAIAVGSSADLKVGQAAFAIGNPFGLDQSLTTGIISALKRRLPTSAGREISNVIQTDAAINPGNSGGPLLDSAGRLIGVNTAIFSPSGAYAGIGFAIPVDVVNRVVPGLIRDGRVPTPGIGIQAASEAMATRLGTDGIVIVATVPGSPAARAGLRGINPGTKQLGDIITAANKRKVQRLSDLTEELERVGVGNSVELTLNRAGSLTIISVEVTDIDRDVR